MTEEFKGTISLDVRDSQPDWAPFLPPQAQDGAPNVVYIVWDDVGLAAFSCFGSHIVETPSMDRLADMGIRFSQWHTTALCSPTRASLLTGRNCHRNGMACIVEGANGFPGMSAVIPPENGSLAEILRDNGYSTYAIGKWHLSPDTETHQAASRRTWPTGRGFDRFYGFLGGETNQWYPDLVHDNHDVEQPYMPEDGYHLSKDLADTAIRFIADTKQADPDRPFSSITRRVRPTRRITRPRSGSRSIAASSTKVTSNTVSMPGNGCWTWGSCQRARSCPRSILGTPTSSTSPIWFTRGIA